MALLECRINGPGGLICVVRIDAGETVAGLRRAIEASTGIAAASQQLFYGDLELRDGGGLRGVQPRVGQEHVDLLLLRKSRDAQEWLGHVDAYPGWFRGHAPPDAREHREVVLAAIVRDERALQGAAPALQADRELVLAALARNGRALGHVDAAFRADRECVLAAVAHSGWFLRDADTTMQADRQCVLAAVSEAGSAFRYASPALRSDAVFVLEAVALSGLAAKHADPALMSDRDFVLRLLAQEGPQHLREWAAPALWDDRAFVLAAVSHHGDFLRYAPSALRGDQEILSVAIAQNPGALQHAPVCAQLQHRICTACEDLCECCRMCWRPQVGDDGLLRGAS